jgi:hypothetical protein
MVKEKNNSRPKMYIRLVGGYVRVNSIQDQYIYDVLSANRSVVHKVLGYTACKLFGHVLDNTTIICRGYTSKFGQFVDALCKRCRQPIIYKERLENDYKKWIF